MVIHMTGSSEMGHYTHFMLSFRYPTDFPILTQQKVYPPWLGKSCFRVPIYFYQQGNTGEIEGKIQSLIMWSKRPVFPRAI